MLDARLRYLIPLLAVGVVAAIAIADTGGERMGEPDRKPEKAVGLAPETPPKHVRWIAFGGGIEPASNQVSIEQDLALVGELLGEGGITLFAGGVGASPVQVLDTSDKLGLAGGLHRRLGDLFWPQDGRSAQYRPTRLQAHGDARAETVMGSVIDALEAPTEDPLFVFVAAHGDAGQRRNENLVRLWGGMPISVLDLTELLDELADKRPLRMVMATCFSGGFAEIAFTGANEARGATPADRCGLFATTWDTEAAGCDPNPDRRAQESYFLHLLHALQGHDREGHRARIDLDGDGRISLLEAHTRVRIASRSISVPTTTSERWLRYAASRIDAEAEHEREPPAALMEELVEERAVVAALSDALSVEDAEAAVARLTASRAEAKALEAELHDRNLALEVVSADLRIALLERWPVLDDPYHPGYAATLAQNEAGIRKILDASLVSINHRQAQAGVTRLHRELDQLDIDIGMLRRLVRAYENVAAAARLRDHDPDGFKRWLAFLACERAHLPIPDAPPR